MGTKTNWRVLQASAHADVLRSLEIENTGLTPLHQVDTKPDNIFDYYSSMTRNTYEERNVRTVNSVGTVLKSVRSLLAEWLIDTPQETDWEPTVPAEYFEFKIPSNTLSGFCDCCDHKELHGQVK